MPQKKNNPAQSDFDDEEMVLGPFLGQDKKPYQIFEVEATIREISIYLNKAILDPLLYAELIHTIRYAGPNDTIKLYLNTLGGNVATGIQIINAIRESAATVITILDGEACSMGAILFLSGDVQQVGDNGTLMFHMYSSGLIGKGNEQLAAVLSAQKSYGKLLANVCAPFLSEQEITDVLNGRDLWLDSDEVIERLTAITKQREDEAKAAEKAKREEVRAAAAKAKAPARKPARKPAQKSRARPKSRAKSAPGSAAGKVVTADTKPAD